MVLNNFPVQKPWTRAPTCTWMVGTEFWPLVRAGHTQNHQTTSPVSWFLKVSWQSFYWLVLGVGRRVLRKGCQSFYALPRIYFVYICVCTCVCMCVCGHACVHVCMEARGHCLVSFSIALHLLFLRQCFLLTPVLTDWLEWSVAEIHHNHNHNLFKCEFRASDLRYLWFHSRHFNWAISPAFRIWYLFIIHASEFFIKVLN